MHLVFEGVVIRHLNHLFHHIVENQHMSLNDINEAIKYHQYGYSELDTKPRWIDRESSNSDFIIKQSGTYINHAHTYTRTHACMHACSHT